MVRMFKSRVLPILEYNSEVWSPSGLGDIDRIESVQRKFTRRINGLFAYTYAERLEICNLESLELRRLKKDMIYRTLIYLFMIYLCLQNYQKSC